ADTLSGTTTVYPRSDGPAAGWSFPGWYRTIRVAPDGQSALAFTDDAPLSSSDERKTPIFIHARADGTTAMITIGDLASRNMPVTASHYLAFSDLSETDAGWLVRLPDGGGRIVAWADGAIDYNPSPRTLYRPGRQGFEHYIAAARTQLERSQCVTYRILYDGAVSRSWRSHPIYGSFIGPVYPIPRLPDTYMDGCVYATPDNQIDVITIHHRDDGPGQALDPEYDTPYFEANGPLYGIVPIDASASADNANVENDGRAITMIVNRSPGVGSKEVVFDRFWNSPITDPHGEKGHGVAVWRTLQLSSPAFGSQELAAMLETLDEQWASDAKIWDGTRKRNVFTEQSDGVGYWEQVTSHNAPMIVMAYRNGTDVTGRIFRWNSDAPYTCYSGTLTSDGRVVIGRERTISPLDKNANAEIVRNATIDLNSFGPMRLPPAVKVAEIERLAPHESVVANCRMALKMAPL
ncbi:MAG: hypothetical protein WA908_12895, partial [Pontixanthobacter sp.]